MEFILSSLNSARVASFPGPLLLSSARFEANLSITVAIKVADSNGVTCLTNYSKIRIVLEIVLRRIFVGLPCCLRRRAEKEERNRSCCDISVCMKRCVKDNYFLWPILPFKNVQITLSFRYLH